MHKCIGLIVSDEIGDGGGADVGGVELGRRVCGCGGMVMVGSGGVV